MKTTRREFLAAAAAAPVPVPDSPGYTGQVWDEGAGARLRRPHYEAIHDWGVLPPRIKWGNTHGVVEDSQGNIYVHHTVHATMRERDSMVVSTRRASSFDRGAGVRGVARPDHRTEGRDNSCPDRTPRIRK